MSETFTPGPWRFEAVEPREIVLKRRHWQIGQSRPPAKGVGFAFGNNDANARLIAAAPNLYGRLDVIARRLRRAADVLGERGFTDQANDLRNQAEWAEQDLARARGDDQPSQGRKP